jgi:predicted CXXCH cytochrome family protein
MSRLSSGDKKKIAAVSFLLGLGLSLVYACAPTTQAQYRTLSFFFDGVPNPELKKAEQAAREAKDDTGLKGKKSKFTEHGPFAAKECSGCHQRGTNALVAPLEDLCFRCHQLDLKKGWTHGPVASGGCRVCHNPHSSGFPFLLMAKPSEFCYYCHNPNDVSRSEVHKGTTLQCTICHDAHSADNRFLLKKQVPPEKVSETPLKAEEQKAGEAPLKAGEQKAGEAPLKTEEQKAGEVPLKAEEQKAGEAPSGGGK